MAYVYRHIRLDKNEPFYIGIGSDTNGDYIRAYDFNLNSRRNKIWCNIASKTAYEVEIMLDGLTWEEACEKEKEFIKLYGRKDLRTGMLSNMTDGGDGTFGYKHTESTKQIIKDHSSGRLHKDAARRKISIARKGMKFSDKHIENLKLSHLGNSRTLEARIKHSTSIKKYDVILDVETGIYYNTAVELAHAYNIQYNGIMNYILTKGKSRFKVLEGRV